MVAPSRLIVFYSPAPESGKSTAADYLIRQHGFELVKFADTLKVMARTFLVHAGITPVDLDSYIEGHRKTADLAHIGFPGLTTRRVLQTLGSEWGRDTIDKETWVRITVNRVREHLNAGRRVVVDDLRYPNELAALRALGGVTPVYISRASAVSNGHPSDGVLHSNDFHYIVTNDETIPDLRAKIAGIAKAPSLDSIKAALGSDQPL